VSILLRYLATLRTVTLRGFGCGGRKAAIRPPLLLLL
jgi:hypothetical protein